MREGRSVPSVADVAAVADISRRTAYRYFPTAEQLATEAALESLAPHLEPAVTGPADGDDVVVRVASTVRQMMQAAVENETLLRAMIRLTIDTPPPPEGGRRASSRGSRRVRWLNDALAPIKRQLDRRTYERLLSALCLCVGAEALIALRDARGLSTKDAVDVCVWTAERLVAAALSGAPTPRRRRRAS